MICYRGNDSLWSATSIIKNNLQTFKNQEKGRTEMLLKPIGRIKKNPFCSCTWMVQGQMCGYSLIQAPGTSTRTWVFLHHSLFKKKKKKKLFVCLQFLTSSLNSILIPFLNSIPSYNLSSHDFKIAEQLESRTKEHPPRFLPLLLPLSSKSWIKIPGLALIGPSLSQSLWPGEWDMLIGFSASKPSTGSEGGIDPT